MTSLHYLSNNLICNPVASLSDIDILVLIVARRLLLLSENPSIPWPTRTTTTVEINNHCILLHNHREYHEDLTMVFIFTIAQRCFLQTFGGGSRL